MLVGIAAGSALAVAEIKIEVGLYTWADLPVALISQLVAISAGMTIGAAVGIYALKPARTALQVLVEPERPLSTLDARPQPIETSGSEADR